MNLLDIINYIKEYIKDLTITPTLYYKLKNDLIEKFKLDKPIINEIINKLFLVNYKFNIFSDLDAKKRWIENTDALLKKNLID